MRSLGLYCAMRPSCSAANCSGSSPGMRMAEEARPWRNAFCEEMALPDSVRGPVDLFFVMGDAALVQHEAGELEG